MPSLRVKQTPEGVIIEAKIVPGSSKTSFEGVLDGKMKIKVAAPPEKGKANKELISFLAKKMGLRKKDIEVISGLISPVKQIVIRNVSQDEVLDILK